MLNMNTKRFYEGKCELWKLEMKINIDFILKFALQINM
jgi:hypothetical protein